MPKERQQEMEFSYRYPVEEMGYLPVPQNLPHFVSLRPEFLREKLQAHMLFGRIPVKEEDRITKVVCPFCQKGFLKLVAIKPVLDGGPGNILIEKKHVGNTYTYVCTNDRCDGRFFGEDRWMWF